jgi:putative OPT family oligopeptide transporter
MAETESYFESFSSPDPVRLTVRSVLTGMLLGGVFSLCNIYIGLKVGWGMGVSVTAALLGFGFWKVVHVVMGGKEFSIHEDNLNQTAASSAGAISSAGLVAPIPALAILTGQTLSWAPLAIWLFSVCLVGILVAVGLRKQMIEVDRLPFPSGTATAKTLEEIYAKGNQAASRLWMLIGTAVLSSSVKMAEHFYELKRMAMPWSLAARSGGAITKSGASGLSGANLGFGFEPTLMMYGVGMLVGPRVGTSLFLGSLVAWLWLAPLAFDHGWIPLGQNGTEELWYVAGLKWLLWPGVSLMVFSALTSFAFSWRSVLAAFMPGTPIADVVSKDDEILPRKYFLLALLVVTLLSVTLQVIFFNIAAWVATLGVLLTFVLALVATRVSGETNITPVGAMGKVTQLVFAVLAPGQPAPNLMAACVTGGAASQCADLMHDLKTGHLIGTPPRLQMIAQVFGALAGSLIGAAGYLILIKNPATELLTEQWPAPSVAAWKAVAELFMTGLKALPTGAVAGMWIGGLIGIALAVAEKVLPKKVRAWVPSPTSVGLGFVIPAFNGISIFIGAMLATALEKVVPSWSARFLIICSSGIIAGESLSGVALAIMRIVSGG